jgi:DNA-directed RNA polymerase subunit M/transcription elongation factor TFIIS
MSRRSPYTRVLKENQVREEHIKGMGDVLFKGFQCLQSSCKNFLFVRKDEINEEFEIECPVCNFTFKSGDETKFYDYKLENFKENEIIEEGEFTILHDDYIDEAQEYKYCIVCNTIKPTYLFDKHSARTSGHQGECRLCKGVYNSIKNQSRISDQHREAAQKRRMYLDLSGQQKIDSKVIHERFGFKCFKCGKDLSNVESAIERPLDHTLPIYYLFPLNTNNATLLCRDHNGEKSGKWPSEYYSVAELKKLSIITGIDYDVLQGKSFYNTEAIENLQKSEIVDALLTKYSAYMDEIIKLRNRLVKEASFDFFKFSKIISPVHIEAADKQLKK